MICLLMFNGSQPKVIVPLELPQQFLNALSVDLLPIKRQHGLNSSSCALAELDQCHWLSHSNQKVWQTYIHLVKCI